MISNADFLRGQPGFDNAIAVNVSATDQALTPACRSLWIGVAGNVAVTMSGGGNVTFTNVPVGHFKVNASAVLHSGTTASGIIAVW